jgi:hypothetical protein
MDELDGIVGLSGGDVTAFADGLQGLAEERVGGGPGSSGHGPEGVGSARRAQGGAEPPPDL